MKIMHGETRKSVFLGVITKSVHYVTTCYVLHVLTNCSIAFLAESRYEVIILADGG